MNDFVNSLSAGLIVGLVVLVVWSSVWKAMALWRAARRSDLTWFIVFLIVNTAGLLEIYYIYKVSRSPKAGEIDKSVK